MDGTEPAIPDEWHPPIWMAAAGEGAGILDWMDKQEEMEGKLLRYIAERKSPYEAASFSGGRTSFNIRT